MADLLVSHITESPDAAGVLSRAVVRAAHLLQLAQRDVAAILGVSDATASRLFAGRYVLAPERAKEWELARLFLRFYRALDALWGHEASAHAWLSCPNIALGARRPGSRRHEPALRWSREGRPAARGRI